MIEAASPPPRIGARREQGFSLLEMMVALLIGMLITGAMVMNYSSLRRTYGVQDGLAQLQDAQRLILTMLTTTVQQAGFYANPATDSRAAALPTATVAWVGSAASTLAAGQRIIGIGDSSGIGAASDGIAVRFQSAPGDGLMNCLGGSNPATATAPVVWVNVYQINATNELTCSVNGATPVPLVGNVRQLRIEYGVDVDGNGEPDTYLPATAVTAGTRWDFVHTVRVRFVLFDPTAPTATALPAPLVQLIDLKNPP